MMSQSEAETQHRVMFMPDLETRDHRWVVVKPVIHLDVVADCRTRDAAEKLAAELNARDAT
jgi:hypothetical protein